MRVRHHHRALAGLASLALLAGACNADSDGSTASATNAPSDGDAAEVRISDFVYRPADLTVATGTTVTWINEDFFGHTVTSGEPGAPTDRFDGVLGEVADAEGMDFSHTFVEPGTFTYFCRFHPRMTATVTVTG